MVKYVSSTRTPTSADRWAGKPAINDEADGVAFVPPGDLDKYEIHPSMREQIGDYLSGSYPYLG
jgi:hypothetical protein